MNKIQMKLGEAIDIFASLEGLANSHLANFFTHNLWKQLPEELSQELVNCSTFQLLNQNCSLIRKLREFQKEIHESCLLSLSDLKLKLERAGRNWPEMVQINSFASVKKQHEVPRIAQIAESLGERRILDLGGGKGYLSTLLAEKTFFVLGLESSSLTIDGAEERARKLVKGKRETLLRSNFKQVAVYVTPEVNVGRLMNEHFPGDDPIGMTGLHTCGDLAATCLRIFAGHPDVRWVVNVGCCYHLIEEEFFTSPFWNDLDVRISDCFGFPMSSFLRSRRFRLGRNARMLAAHSLEKIELFGVNKDSIRSIFFRALLQIVIERIRGHSLIEGQVPKRLGMRCNNIIDYFRKSMHQMDLHPEMSDDEILELYNSHRDDQAKLTTYFTLRAQMAPLIESIILLDRLLFLQEQNIENAFLVPVFDATVSPRNIAVVAWR